MRLHWFAAALAATLLHAGSALAQFPDKPITLVVPYPPGGGADISARLLAPVIERHLGSNARIVVTNRPGALSLQKLAGVSVTQVPFPGTAGIRSALSGQHITMGALAAGEVKAFIDSGSPFRVLVQMTATRSPWFPDVPTLKELGYDVEASSARSLAAPGGLPPDVRKKLVTAIGEAVNAPEFLSRAAAAYAPVRYMTPEQFGELLKGLDAYYQKVWKETPWNEN